jgi:hypothetical protein
LDGSEDHLLNLRALPGIKMPTVPPEPLPKRLNQRGRNAARLADARAQLATVQLPAAGPSAGPAAGPAAAAPAAFVPSASKPAFISQTAAEAIDI